jgi:hypothetical protein
MRHGGLHHRWTDRRRPRVEATGAADFVGAAVVAIVAFTGLRTPAECLHTRCQGPEQEQSQDQDDHAPLHSGPSVPDFPDPRSGSASRKLRLLSRLAAEGYTGSRGCECRGC